MYKVFIRPILFCFSPETVHYMVVSVVKLTFKLPGIRYIIRSLFASNNSKLETEFCGIKFKNPVGFAAGFDKNAEIYNEFTYFGFSFIEIGTVTPKPQPGNEKPRSFRLIKDSALINRMGFNNKGLKSTIEQLRKRKTDIIIGGNIGKNTLTPNHEAIHDYIENFKELYDYVDYFVVNISCPNIKDLKELQDKDMLESILREMCSVRSKMPIRKPILLKISPDLNNSQLDDIIDVIFLTKIDGIVATNTTVTRNRLKTSEQVIDRIGNGGLSGRPLKDRATEVIKYISIKTNKSIPIIGVGGIMSPEDALEKLEAGATLIQVYTGFIYEGPGFVKKINKAILKYKSHKYSNL